MKRYADNLAALSGATLVLLSAAFLLIPIVVSLAMSIDGRGYLAPFPPADLSLQWFRTLFSNNYYLQGLGTSLLLATSTTIVSTLIGLSGALALDRYDFRGKQILASLFMASLVAPAVVLGFALFLFFSNLGIRAGFLPLLCGHVLITTPYVIRTTLAGLGGIRPSLVEAALSLGANERRAFWDVTLPLAKTGIIAGAIFAFAFSFDDVGVSMFLSSPDTYTLPVALLSMMRANFDLTIAAASALLVASTVILVVVLDRVVGLDRVIGTGIYRI